MRIRTRIFSFLIGVSLFSILCVFSLAAYYFHTNVVEASRSKLEAVANIQKNRIETGIREDKEHLAIIRNRVGLIDYLVSYKKTNSETDQQAIVSRIIDSKKAIDSFECITIYNIDGTLVASSNPEYNISDFYDINDIKLELDKDYVEISVKKERKLIIHGPIYKDGNIMAVLVIVSNINDLTSITTDYSGLGQTGETVLAVFNDEGDAEFVNNPRFATKNLVMSKNDHGLPIIQALEKNEGIFTNRNDYRGVGVTAITKYIPETEWGMSVKIDNAEINKPIYQYSYGILGIGLTIILIVTLVSYFLAESITKPIRKLVLGTELIIKGDLKYRTALNTKDEIGDLSNKFDKMTNSLEENINNVEAKVVEKTADLEQINKAMVGRELKMIELKKENSELYSQLKKKNDKKS
jgi:methyl-accepting chemotaxis protein